VILLHRISERKTAGCKIAVSFNNGVN
jgi:hypothetical protein